MTLKQEEVLQKIKIPNSTNAFNDCRIEDFEIGKEDYKAEFSRFYKFIFDCKVKFEDVDLLLGLNFEDCVFEYSTSLHNIEVHSSSESLVSSTKCLNFKKCIFKEIFILNGRQTNIEGQLFFTDCIFEKGIIISDIRLLLENLIFKDCVINYKLDILNTKCSNDIKFENNKVQSRARLENINGSMLSFVGDNIFEDNIFVGNSKIKNGVIFNNGRFKNEIKFDSIETEGNGLTIIDSFFEKAFFVNIQTINNQLKQGISSFYLSDASFNNGFYVNGAFDFMSDIPIINEIIFDISAKLRGDVVFRDIDVGILSISGYNTSVNISFERVFVNQLKITGFRNSAGLIFSNLVPSHSKWYSDKAKKMLRGNALYVSDTNFGKAQFYQTHFNSFDTIVFHNVICTDISTSLVKWFTPAQLDRNELSSMRKTYKKALKTKNKIEISNAVKSLESAYQSKKEIFRQLKYASQKQGDIPLSLEFLKWEMDYYRKIVCLKKPKNWSEVIILWSSQTNNYGQSWLKALGLFVVFSFLFYLPIGFFNSNTIDYSKFALSWSNILNNLRMIFYDNFYNWVLLLNPVHNLKDLNENIKQAPSIIYVFDFLSRIVSSYFIFQIVSAFRKYFK